MDEDWPMPPPGFEMVLETAQSTGKPAWDFCLDGDLVLFGWATISSDAADVMPLGHRDAVIAKLRRRLEQLEREG
jgi:hypothetical protein